MPPRDGAILAPDPILHFFERNVDWFTNSLFVCESSADRPDIRQTQRMKPRLSNNSITASSHQQRLCDQWFLRLRGAIIPYLYSVMMDAK